VMDRRKIIEIMVTSGLLGVLMTTTANLVISYRSLHGQKEIETHKAFVSFTRERFDLLNSNRIILEKYQVKEAHKPLCYQIPTIDIIGNKPDAIKNRSCELSKHRPTVRPDV